MNVVIYGTSNCFPGSSFVTALKKSANVSNFSVGASTSIHPMTGINEIDLSLFDVCLLDFAINDEGSRQTGVSLDRLKNTLLSTAARAWAAGCIPVLLIFPSRGETQHASPVRAMHLQIAQESNFPYLDVYQVMESTSNQLSIFSVANIFKDAAHLFWWFDGNLGTFLGTALTALTKVSDPLPWLFQTFSAIDLSKYADQVIPAVTRTSSAVHGTFLQLRAGQSVEVAIPSGSVVAGYVSNFKYSHAILLLKGETEIAVDLRSFYNSWNGEIVRSALHLAEEVCPKGGLVYVQALVPGCPLNTPAFSSHPRGAETAVHDTIIEISHLIVKRLEPSIINSKLSLAMHVDLWEIAPPHARDLFLTRTREQFLQTRKT